MTHRHAFETWIGLFVTYGPVKPGRLVEGQPSRALMLPPHDILYRSPLLQQPHRKGFNATSTTARCMSPRVDDSPDEADAPIKVSTDEIIPPTMMIKKVFIRDGEKVKNHWRKLCTD
ncbi:hypothetical protein PF005_g4776 [Phytophthora fragariae]|uniref:Uncharacterized protein n=1 Tax=Phytophthora fragariae TaxID=53985 RepID=A0A6A4A6A1_9STRA|nr:hypothetical protein PF011_g3821 [Phytophthora fragariae]KAE9227266.1 hypothetical protein PF005_g4776 [Phytophthora fragariae]KAE9248777.1 hypothetical protein PF002_g5608 [Phytophthora fragariae]